MASTASSGSEVEFSWSAWRRLRRVTVSNDSYISGDCEYGPQWGVRRDNTHGV